MKRFIALLLVVFATTVSATVHWLPPVKYGQQFTLYFAVADSNSPWRFYETPPAAADVHVFQDGASEAKATNAVTDLGRTFSLVLTNTEMTAAVVTVDVNDASNPPLYGDEIFYIPTYGHASALGAFDLDTATVTVGTNSDKTNYTLSTAGIDALEDDLINNNNKKNSLAWYVKRAGGGDPLAITGTARAGGSTNTIILAADASADTNAYIPCTVKLLTGTGAPTSQTGLAYNGTTKAMTIVGTWPLGTPNATTTYLIEMAPSSYFAAEGVAQAGTTNTIQCASGDIRADNMTGLVILRSGTGSSATVYAVRDSWDANDTLAITGTWAGSTPDTTTYYAFVPNGGTVTDTTSPNPGLTLADAQAAAQAALTAQGLTPTVAANLGTTAADWLEAGRLDAIVDTIATNALAAKTAAEKLDTPTELRTLLTGSDTALSTVTTATIWANAQRTLTALDEDDTAIDLNGTTVNATATVDAASLLAVLLTGNDDTADSLGYWIRYIANTVGSLR